MIQKFLKDNSKTLIVILIFFLVSIVYFMPAINGYSLKQGDIEGYNGMAKELNDYAQSNDEQALWTNSMFSGMPGYLIRFEKVNPIYSIYSFIGKVLKYPISALFFAFISFYLLARSLKVNFLIALFGSLAYGFTAYNIIIIGAGHTTKMMAIAIIPGVIGSMIMMYRCNSRKSWLAFGILSLFFAFEFMVNHIQMTYYFILILLAVGVSEFFRIYKEKAFKRFAIRSLVIVFAGVIGLASNFSNYYFMNKYSKHSMRGPAVISPKLLDKEEVKEERSAYQIEYDSLNNTNGLKRDYITHWSYGKQETYNLLVPNAKGSNAVTRKMFDELAKSNRQVYETVFNNYQQSNGKVFGGYWGDQPGTSGPNYIGAIIVFLALLYMFLINTPLKWTLLVVSILVILLSWGKNLGGGFDGIESIKGMWLTNFFIDYVPLYCKFRTVSSILVVVNLIFPFMAVLMLNKLIYNKEWVKTNFKKITYVALSIVGFILVITMIPGSFFDFTNVMEERVLASMQNTYVNNGGINPQLIKETVVEARESIFRADSLRTLGFIVAFLFVAYLNFRNILKEKLSVILILVLTLSDLWFQNLNYVNNDKKENSSEYAYWEKRDGSENIPKATDADEMIFNIEAQQKPALIPVIKQKAQEFRIKNKGKISKTEMESIKYSTLNLNTNYRVTDIDNPFNSSRASYFHKSIGGYHPAKLRRYQDMIDFYIGNELNSIRRGGSLRDVKVLNMLNNKYFTTVDQKTRRRVLALENPFIYGNAWIVSDVKWVESNDEEISAIKNTDLRNTTILHKEFKELIKDPVTSDSTASIYMEEYKPHYLRYNYTSSQPNLVVFSEVYYKDGWNAYVDGEKASHYRTNYILRGMQLPGGNHIVEFKFEPTGLKMSNMINILCFLIMLGAIVLGVYFNRNSKLVQEVK